MTAIDRQRWPQWRDDQAFRRFHLVVALSLLIRLLALYLVRHAALASDAQDYVDVARQLLTRRPFIPYWPPGLPIYLAPFVAHAAGDVILRASMLVFWILSCWGLRRLMTALDLAPLAWLVLLPFALFPDAVQLSIEPLTQLPVAALLLLALSATLNASKRTSPSEYLLLGASLGLMCLVRPSAVPLCVLLPLACLAAPAQSPAVAVRKRTLALAAAVLALTFVAGWVDFAHRMTGRWIVNTANAQNIYYGNNPWTPLYATWYFGSHAKLGTPEIEKFPDYQRTIERVATMPELDRPAEFQRLAIASIRQSPGRFLIRAASRVRCFFAFDIFTAAALKSVRIARIKIFPAILVLEALCFLLLLAPTVYWIAQASAAFWRDRPSLILLASVLVYAVPYWLTMSHPTYNFPVILPLAVMGITAWQAFGRTRTNSCRGWAAVAILTLIQIEWVWQMSHSAALR